MSATVVEVFRASLAIVTNEAHREVIAVERPRTDECVGSPVAGNDREVFRLGGNHLSNFAKGCEAHSEIAIYTGGHVVPAEAGGIGADIWLRIDNLLGTCRR